MRRVDFFSEYAESAIGDMQMSCRMVGIIISLLHLFGFLQNRSGYLKNSEGLARGSAGGPGAIASAFAGAGVDF